MTHADVRELIACHALGALEPSDAALVQEHLVDCGFCANLAREAAEVAHYLPYAAPSRPTPAGSLDRLLATIGPDARVRDDAVSRRAASGAYAGSPPGGDGQPGGRPRPGEAAGWSATPAERQAVAGGSWLEVLASRLMRGVRTPVFAPVAAAALLVLGLGGWNMALMSELKDERRQMSFMQNRLAQQTHLMVMVTSPATVTKPLQGTPLAPSAEIRLVMDGETNTAMLMASRLPALPAGHVYEVWLGRQGARMPAARLLVDEQGDGECSLQLDGSVHSYDSAWITVEPAEGGPAPNSPGVARGFL